MSAWMVNHALAEFQAPLAERFVGEGDAAHSHELFHIAIAKVEAEVQPEAMAQDLGGETMSAVERDVGLFISR